MIIHEDENVNNFKPSISEQNNCSNIEKISREGSSSQAKNYHNYVHLMKSANDFYLIDQKNILNEKIRKLKNNLKMRLKKI